MHALSAKEIGHLKDHFIESVTENWRYFRSSPNLAGQMENIDWTLDWTLDSTLDWTLDRTLLNAVNI